MGVPCWLLCGMSIALPLFVRADGCNYTNVRIEAAAVGQPFAFKCKDPLLASRETNVTWYKASGKIPVSEHLHSRVHQDQTWIVFLPLSRGDSGLYQCVIKSSDGWYRICVNLNLTTFENHWCDTSRRTASNLSNNLEQILTAGTDGSLMCHLQFPESCVLGSIKWYKGCKEISGKRFMPTGRRLLVSNVLAEDRGDYACAVRLTYLGREYTVVNSINLSVKRPENGGKIPKIIYPKNNSIEVQLGSTLIVDCNITDNKENTNLRCWRVNNTLVDNYYSESKRIREGIETNVSFKEHIFYTVNLTFLEVKMEDYGLPFTCHAGVSAAYIVLTLPAPDFRVYLIGGLIAVTVLVASVLSIYNHFKIDIVLWYRSAFRSAGAVEDGKLYDAYVLYPKLQSHSQNVDTLVLKLLPEVLERQCRYKLFIFGRDEFPGQAVASVIDENIQLCRRLILIVVPESPSSGLFKTMSEEQIAVYNALIQEGMKVILIELDKIEDYSTMPESIQYIRQKHGAIRWSGDFTEQSQCAKTRFWKKVRYHMPRKKYPPSPSPGAHGL